MQRLFIFFIITLFSLLYSCKEITREFGGNEEGELINGITNQIEEYVEPVKEIRWKDGNTYTYDETETFIRTDSLGNEVTWTIYKSKYPEYGLENCSSKVCNWCGKTTYASSYSIEEYPDMGWLRGQPNLGSIFGIMGMMFSGHEQYLDFENHRVRTEWNVDCEYFGPAGFCSNKCQYEYNNR